MLSTAKYINLMIEEPGYSEMQDDWKWEDVLEHISLH